MSQFEMINICPQPSTGSGGWIVTPNKFAELAEAILFWKSNKLYHKPKTES